MNTTCKKRTYKTEEEAKSHLMWIVENNHYKNKVPCRYYKCQWCGNYHLTSQTTIVKYGLQKGKEVDNEAKGKAPGVSSITPARAVSVNR